MAKTHECCSTLSLRRTGDDLHISLHKGFKIRLAGIVPVSLEFSLFGAHWFTPLYAILNGRGNLRFDKEGYFHVLISTGYFIKEIENMFSPCSNTLWKHSWKFGRTQNNVEIWRFPLQFLVLPNFHSCFYNYMETRKMFSIS